MARYRVLIQYRDDSEPIGRLHVEVNRTGLSESEAHLTLASYLEDHHVIDILDGWKFEQYESGTGFTWQFSATAMLDGSEAVAP